MYRFFPDSLASASSHIFFFFQAEDGIRDDLVTGVQTCALPIFDDEADIRDLVAGILDDEGFATRTARDSDSALAEIANLRPHPVFLDIWLHGSKLDGLQLLEQIKKDHAHLPIVMISVHGNIETPAAT